MAGVSIFSSINNVGTDSHFIRLKANKNLYAHLKSDVETDDERKMEFDFKHGYKGAVCFLSDQADNFLKLVGDEAAADLEKVKVIDIIPPDGSLN